MYSEFCVALSLSHDVNLIKETNVSLIINISYTDTKSTCHTESALNAGTLIGLKMQLPVEIYNLLDVLNAVLKQLMAGLLPFKKFFLEFTYNCSKTVTPEEKRVKYRHG